MRKLDFINNHLEFINWIIWYGDFLLRLIEAKKIVRTKFEKLEILEAFILRCSVRWEVLISNDIIISLNHDSSYYANELGLRLRKHLTKDECKAIVFGHKYLDFRSVEELKAFGKKYLVPIYNPFKGIAKKEAKIINEFLIMRNYLSHYSDYSKRAFKKIMKGKYNYLRIPEPGSFLLSIKKDGEYRWSYYLRTFIKASNDMLKIMKLI